MLTAEQTAAIPALTPRDKWPQWVRDMHTEGPEVEVTPEGRVIWWGGTIHDGLIVGPIDFLGGSIRDGIVMQANFFRGIIDFVDWRDGYIGNICVWRDGVFRKGEFHGLWLGGLFLGGTFKGNWRDGRFAGGVFNGTWQGGNFDGGILVSENREAISSSDGGYIVPDRLRAALNAYAKMPMKDKEEPRTVIQD